MSSPGPYVVVTIALVGFALCAALHHIYLWFSRRERSSLLFVAFCLPAAALSGAHTAIATTTSLAGGQRALDLRTTFGLVAYAVLPWLIGSISGLGAGWYRRTITVLLLSGAVLNQFVYPIVGSVTEIQLLTLPWGEQVTTLARVPGSTWFPRLIYVALMTIQVYAFAGARTLWPRDRTAAVLMALAGLSGLAGSIIGFLVDSQLIRGPYLGQLAFAAWVLLLAVLLSREHVRRAERLVASEQSLRASEERLGAVINHSPGVAIQWYDGDGRVLLWNRASEEMFGYAADEAIGQTLDRLIHTPEEFATFRESLGEIARTGQSIGPAEFTFRRRLREPRVCVSTIFQIPGSTGAETRFVCMDVDITDRVQLEEQLRQSQKMEAIGQLAGGVAHDFNNLLAIISGYTDLLQQQLGPKGPHRELIDAIQEASGRAASLIERLLAFSRQTVPAPELVELDAVVRDAESMLRRLIPENVELSVELRCGPHRVRIDPTQWSQVILNLAINARDAMPHGGRLVIATSELASSSPSVGHPDRSPGHYAQLAVSDTGCGMPPDVAGRIFEPFFTTKPVGKGTGLGLAVVHGIVTQAGGFIEVSSTPDVGTTFMVHVPLVLDEVEVITG